MTIKMKQMKYISYLLSWGACVFGSAVVYDLLISVILAFYVGNYFDSNMPLTIGVYVIIFIVGLLIPCFFLALSADGVASSHYVGEKNTSLAVMIINQIASSAIYVVMGPICGYNRRCYYTVSLLSNIINEANRDIITNANEDIWMLLITVLHMLVFTAVAVSFYLITRRERINKYINATERSAEQQEEQ